MFDCVLPTRCARNGLLFTTRGRLNMRNAVRARDERPPDPDAAVTPAGTHSRAYLRHLFVADELLALRLATLHNLHHYLGLMGEARAAIGEDRFGAFADRIRSRNRGGSRRASEVGLSRACASLPSAAAERAGRRQTVPGRSGGYTGVERPFRGAF